MAEPFSYDVVDYPSTAMPQVHPGHLHAVARVFGLDPAPADGCRYLEIGCGDGTHLLACGLVMPGSTFVGVDLSEAAVERGRRVVAELGLPNVSLYAADLTAWEPPAGGFDYAVAHGLYSWVPAPVRDALLGLIARVLPPHGVGYVSYNTYPGCYARRMLWEILRFHTADVADPAEKIRQAVEMAKFLAAGRPANESDSALNLLAPELEEVIADRAPGVLYHDDLGEVNDPVYFHQFAAHAARFGLRFVAEAEPHLMTTPSQPPAVAGALNELAARDVVLKEQYLDFLRLRRFRQTLLSPDGQPPRANPDPAAVTTLAVGGNPKPKGEADLSPGVMAGFASGGGASVRTDLPILKAALVALAERWPGRLWFPDLVRAAAGELGREPTTADAEALAGPLTAVWKTGLVQFHGHIPRYAAEVSERPVASGLARLQARTGPLVTTVFLETIQLHDAPTRAMVQLLDGTRTVDEVVAEVLEGLPPDQRPDAAALRAGIDRNLARLAKGGVLVG